MPCLQDERNLICPLYEPIALVEDDAIKARLSSSETGRSIDLAMRRMERDMTFLDDRAGATPQLTNAELIVNIQTKGFE